VSDIFSRFGEERFSGARELRRRSELSLQKAACRRIRRRRHRTERRQRPRLLRAGGVIVCLDVPAEVVSCSLAGDTLAPAAQRTRRRAARAARPL
jgi:hypothetical protein